ncbi:hypothetical protein OX89_02455 [Diaphorobacter sp. J5-51]|nr:hypothetical protein OX89_02455 [Diaphorobacter sp. J5-51]
MPVLHRCRLRVLWLHWSRYLLGITAIPFDRLYLHFSNGKLELVQTLLQHDVTVTQLFSLQ